MLEAEPTPVGFAQVRLGSEERHAHSDEEKVPELSREAAAGKRGRVMIFSAPRC